MGSKPNKFISQINLNQFKIEAFKKPEVGVKSLGVSRYLFKVKGN